MIIANDDFDKENHQSSQTLYILPESEIRAFVKGLRIHNSAAITERLNATFLTIVEMMQNKLDSKPNQTNLLLIKKIAQDYKNKQYRRLMEMIIAAIEPGKERFNPALRTVAHILELVYSSLPEYLSTRRFYEEILGEIKAEERKKL